MDHCLEALDPRLLLDCGDESPPFAGAVGAVLLAVLLLTCGVGAAQKSQTNTFGKVLRLYPMHFMCSQFLQESH